MDSETQGPTPGETVYLEIANAMRTRVSGELLFSLLDSEKSKLKKSVSRHKQSTNRIFRVNQCGSKAKLEVARDKYFTSYHTKICASVRALAKKGQSASFAEIKTFANSLDVYEALSEPVLVTRKEKSNGDYRLIVNSGPRRMAQQWIVRDFLTAISIDSEYDYTRRGAGGEKGLIAAVCAKIDEGYRCWQSADIENYYASLRPSHFDWLPLPKNIIRNVVFLPKCTKVKVKLTLTGNGKSGELMNVGGKDNSHLHHTYITSTRMKVRRELPQGSILSPLVARAFLGRLLRDTLEGSLVTKFSYVDDLTLGARTSSEVAQSFELLRKRLFEHPAGSIILILEEMYVSGLWPSVLGYILKPGRGYGSNTVHVAPGAERFGRFYEKLYASWKAEGCPPDKVNFIEGKLDNWMPSQQAWTQVPYFSKDAAFTRAVIDFCERYEFDPDAPGMNGPGL